MNNVLLSKNCENKQKHSEVEDIQGLEISTTLKKCHCALSNFVQIQAMLKNSGKTQKKDLVGTPFH